MQTSTPLERITERVSRNGDPNDPDTPRPLLRLAEFFDGNEVVGSIGCNLPGTPAPHVLHQALKAIAERPDVVDVRVAVTAFDDPDWPFSDTVYVVTSASPTDVQSWFSEELAPDDTWEGLDGRHEEYAVPEGYRAVCCWWD